MPFTRYRNSVWPNELFVWKITRHFSFTAWLRGEQTEVGMWSHEDEISCGHCSSGGVGSAFSGHCRWSVFHNGIIFATSSVTFCRLAAEGFGQKQPKEVRWQFDWTTAIHATLICHAFLISSWRNRRHRKRELQQCAESAAGCRVSVEFLSAGCAALSERPFFQSHEQLQRRWQFAFLHMK